MGEKYAEYVLVLFVAAFLLLLGVMVSEAFSEEDDEKNCQKLDGEFIVVYKKDMPLLEEPFEVFECKKVKK